MAQENFQEWYDEAQYAVEHLDAVSAYQFLRALDKNIFTLEPEYSNSVNVKSSIQALKKNLRFVAFPELPLEEAQLILAKEILSFLGSGINLDERLTTRFVFVTYGERERERNNLKQAILSNQENIGVLNIGQWLALFDKTFDPILRNRSSIIDFLTHESKVATLSRVEQEILKTILISYENWLVAERLDTIGVDLLNKQGKHFEEGTKIITSTQNRNPDTVFQDASRIDSGKTKTMSLPLLQALSKYENLGNQLITEGRIRVKSQPEPVRPSLLYWLKYYRDELGIGQHSSVERGDFLFRSENGRKLSAAERERVNLILKSVEENFPLSIDTERQEIIFPAFQDVVMATRQEPQPRPAPTVSHRSESALPTTERSASPRSLHSVASAPPLRPLPSLLPSVKAVGTPAFFVPKDEEKEDSHERPALANFSRPYEGGRPVRNDLGTSQIERGAAFNVIKESMTPPVQAKSARPNVSMSAISSVRNDSPARTVTQGAVGGRSDSGRVSFSTNHIFPAEREVAENRASAPKRETPPAVRPSFTPAPVTNPVSTPPRPAAQPLSSYHIHPVSLGGKDREEEANMKNET